LLLAFAAPAVAAEWYLSAYSGASATRPAVVRVEQPVTETRLTFDSVRFDGRSFDSPIYYGYRLGAFVRRWLAFEAEFIHAKIHAQVDREVRVQGTLNARDVSGTAPLARYASRLDESHGLNFVLGNAVFRRRLGRLALTARAGAGLTVPHPETDVLGNSREDYQLGGPCAQGAAGAQLRVWHGLHLLGEYKYTWTRQTIDLDSGEIRMRVRTSHFVTGVAFHF
jgi:lipid A oxidase